MVQILDFAYFFVPVFAFTAIIELLHFLPFAKNVTEKRIYEKMFPTLTVFLFSFLIFELAFLVEVFLESKELHKILELASMTIILFWAVLVVRKNVIELEITNAKKSLLEKSEKRYKNLIETMNDGFWSIDENRITATVNQKTEKMLGYTTKEMIGKDVMHFLDRKAQAEVKQRLKERKKGASETYEIEFTKKDGSKLPVVLSASPIFDEKGVFKGSFAVLTDISERKKMEEEIKSYSEGLETMVEDRTNQLKQTRDSLVNMLEDLTESKKYLAKAYDDLKDIDRLKTDIISNISHELRTPITIAKSALELTREEEEPEETGRFLTMCENALTRLNDIVGNLVDVSSIYKGRFVVSVKALEVERVIKKVIRDFKPAAEKKKIKFNFSVEEPVPKVKADEKSITRALINIVDNSIKFSKEGGRVDVNVKSQDEFVQISIKDSGIGIPKQYLSKVFEPFYQIDPTTTREFGGTGIGLSLTKSHIEAQGGKVWAEGSRRKGAIFYVKLPVA
jgi:PAS domain S-box-containing protein